MGDLKKKKPKDDITTDCIVDAGEGKEIIIEHGNASSDEEVIERLRGYIQKFYEIQVEKMEKAEQENFKKEKDEE